MAWLLWPVAILAFLVGIAGYLIKQTPEGAGWGAVAGIIGAIVVAFQAARNGYPEGFTRYSSDTEGVVEVVEKETCILALTIPGEGTKQIRGLSVDEWQDLAEKVIEREYEFTTRSGLGDYYDRTRGRLLKAKVLAENSKGGVDVTGHVGRHFFNQLKKGDFKILEILPSSTRENV